MYIFVLVIYLFIDIGNDLYICLFAFVLYLCTYTYLYLLQHKAKTIQDISLLYFLYVLIYTPFFLLAELWPVFVPHPLHENGSMVDLLEGLLAEYPSQLLGKPYDNFKDYLTRMSAA